MENKLLLTFKGLNVILFLLIFLSSTAWAATLKGKVIDADTKQPIEGAVVVASWHEETATVAGPSSRLKDVKETLTDKNGEWVIKGPRGREVGNITAIFTFITGTYVTTPPEFIIFKPGYCSWPAGFGIDACKEKIKPEGNDKVADGTTIELPKLTNREDRLRASSIWPGLAGGDLATAKKIENFVKLLDKEEKNLGLSGQGWVRELDAKVSNYLILNDIDSYKQSSKSEFMGIKFHNENKNLREVDITTKRFVDEEYNNYKVYKTIYIGSLGKSSPMVEIKEYSQRSNLLHNVEYNYRDKGWGRIGLLIQGAQLRLIDGNKIIFLEGRGERHYNWVSKNVVVNIICSESNKPEPLEVIQAYLRKFPSTIPASLEFDQNHTKKWIKDEMERRLNISNMLFERIRTATLPEKKALKEAVDSLNVFLEYREKYFGKESKFEKQLLQENLDTNNQTDIKKKLSEYNKWWRENKGESIDLL